MTLQKLLAKLDACSEAQEWAAGYTSSKKAWAECERADWMLWVCGLMADEKGWPTRQQLVLAACACARTALKYVPKGEDRPRVAIETAERWANGEATLDEVRTAATYAAYAYAAAAAAYAAYAAYAADSRSTGCAAAAAATYAADDADDAATRCARPGAARRKALKKMAGIVRKMLKVPVLK